jgi:SAM-dependent methyltransferase
MGVLTPLERRWRELAPPERATSAAALYELLPLQRSGNVPFIDVPYDPRRLDHWAEAARVADFAAALPEGGRAVLDIGPGDGWPSLPLAAALPDTRVIGVDPSLRRVAVCRANARRLRIANAAFVAGDAEHLPLRSASVDLVTASHALEECDDADAALREAARVLRPGGLLRVAFQAWTLPAPVVETVTFVEGVDSLLGTYAVRRREPPAERRYVLVLPRGGAAAEAHSAALIASAPAPRAWGETLVGGWVEPHMERLARLARRSLVVELRRWTASTLVEALGRAGFAEAHGTAHPGDLARAAARERPGATLAEFEAATEAIGRRALTMSGSEMVVARR